MQNTLIRAFSNSGCPPETLCLHRDILQRGILPNVFTLPFMLQACAGAWAAEHALGNHGVSVKLGYVRQVFMGNALLQSYTPTGLLWSSRRFFGEIMLDRNVV